jgi:cobalt-zinc-cadmium efflux system membrane fusion protein
LLQALIKLELNQKRFERISRLGESLIPAREIEEARTARAESEFDVESSIQALSNLGLVIRKENVLDRPVSEIQSELRFLGLPDFLLDTMDPQVTSTNLIPIVSPRGGFVVERHAVAGEVIETNKPLFTIADASQMWLLLNLRLEEVERISIGQKIVFQPDGSEHTASGNVTWISTDVDTQTRTVQVRGELPNPDGRLRNETFGAGQVVLREEENAILVPGDAIHWEGCCHIAFVRDKDYFLDNSFKVFHARSVRPGAKMGDKVEVIAGLLPGEVVVTKGSGILRAELLKGNLGAG